MERRQAIKSSPMPRGWGLGGLAGIVLAVVLAGGALPHIVAGEAAAPPAGGADAIFVLTGGENRIAEGYRAWRDGKGKNLVILGAGRDARLEQILPALPSLPAGDRERVRLEGWSRNTFENAVSAKSFVMVNGYHSVILVTSDYHMPRALRAFLMVLPPDVAVSVLPVRTKGRWGPTSPRMMRVFLVEGWKYWWYRLFLLWE
jgi:uncharacterized SAM-binding protein YcdF (DUF218 family)